MHVTEPISHRRWEETWWAVLAIVGGLLFVMLVAQSAGATPPPPSTEPVFIVSPWTGVFRAGEYPGGPPLVEVGSKVKPDTLVGLIEEFMATTPPGSRPVHAMVTGTISRVLAGEGEVVLVGQPLFQVLPGDSAADQ